MKRHELTLTPRHRRILQATSLTLLLSGSVWAWIHRLDEAAEAGEALRRWKPWLIAVHGLSSVVFVLLFGTLLAGHVPRAWRAATSRIHLGLGLVSPVLLIWHIRSGRPKRATSPQPQGRPDH